MRKKLILLLLPFISQAIDFKKPEDTPQGQKGKEWGETIKGQYGGKGNAGKLSDPLTKQGSPFTMPKGQTFYANPPFCGQGDVNQKTVFARVSVSGNTVSISYASDPTSGTLDKSFSFSGTYLCPEGYCGGWDGSKFTNCMKYSFNGSVSWTSVDTLDNCTDPSKQPQLPTFYGGYFISQLLNYYKSVGKEITYNDHKFEDNVANYYGGVVKDCKQVNKNPSQTEFLSNPYTMNDRAIYYYLTCDPTKDGSCSAVKAFVEGTNSGTSSAVCVINRDVNTLPDNTGRTDKRKCTPGQKLFPDGYDERSVACFSGDKFFDFSSFFWLECKPDGSGYVLQGWGYWEGAPCGTAGSFPPSPQIEVSYPLDQTFDWTQIGRLSVNRRRGGEGLSEGDKVSPQELDCVSNDPTPYTVWFKNTFLQDQNKNILEIKIDNAPACNYFIFSRVQGLVGETYNDCSDLEKQGCKLINEWWTDANGKTYQVIKDGSPVKQLSSCTEILRDESQKLWTSTTQTLQAPPQNCNFPPKTCKVISGQTECRQWWSKRREYKCADVKGSNVRVDLSRPASAISSMDYDPEQGILKYTDDPSRSQVCTTAGQCSPITRTQGKFVCSVSAKPYDTQTLCLQNCFQNYSCNQRTDGYRCAKDGNMYPDENSCRQACLEPAQCNTVYYCPLNSQSYQDQSSCMSSCNNCTQTGSCSPTTKYLCSADGREYDSSSSCQSACNTQGSCSTEYFCPNGGSVSGNQCVQPAQAVCPTGYSYDTGLNKCVSSPQCSASTYNSARDRCETTPTCPSGFTWNSTRLRCERIPTCPSPGTWDTGRQACIANPTQSCVINSATCTVSHPSIGNVNVPMSCTGRSCSGSTNAYAGGYTVNLYCSIQENSSYSSFYGQYYINQTGEYNTGYSPMSACYSGSVQVPVWVYATSSYAYWNFNVSATLQNTCPSPYTLSGGVCTYQGSCPSGSTYDSTNKVCYLTSSTCPSGFTYDASNKVCYKSAVCPSPGVLDTTVDKCTANPQSFSCPSGWTLSGSQCVQPAQTRYKCSIDGQYYSDQNSCQSACVRQGTCSQVSRYVCSLDGSVYSDQSSCQSACQRTVGNCCQAQGLCTGDNRLYPPSTCSSQCFKPAQCSPVYSYVCPLTQQAYSSPSVCQDNCKEQKPCQYTNVQITKYLCSLTLLEYETPESCQSACGGGQNCSPQDRQSQIGTARGGLEEGQKCTSAEDYYCVVKIATGGRPANQFDTVKCVKSGDNWTCPAGGGVVVQDCRCSSSLTSGFGIAGGALEVIYQALKDRSCQ